MQTAKNKICLMFDKEAEQAARFYAETFPNSEVNSVHRAPADYPSGKAGDVLTVEFTVLGIPCVGVNGGTYFKHTEAFSFQIATDNQQETDKYWDAIVKNGGKDPTFKKFFIEVFAKYFELRSELHTLSAIRKPFR